ncbi:MAG: adenylate/guanylate cyclase domain-containing protein [Planctomycetes bacterium]|nr:adenylate/guanylate cyclase domain-containing protein [Planctomycetota bacterium]MCL4729804.1 adenylate/guanylate cyclase domain-containing protein [Planctomycetota bacterium]
MTTAADTAFLDQALTELESVRRWSPRTISKLETLLHSPDPWAVYRVDPINFAAEKGISEQEAIDLLLHAANLGLFHMEWRLLCPLCTDTVSSCRTMSTVKSSCYCHLCLKSVSVNLDDYITVSFNLSPRVRELPWHKPENLSVQDLILRYRIDRRATKPGYGPFSEIMRQFARLADYLQPGESRQVPLAAPEGWVVVVMDAGANSTVIVPTGGGQTGNIVSARLTSQGWQDVPEAVAPGEVILNVRNDTSRRAPLIAGARPGDVDTTGVVMGPFLTGNRLLNNQTFRTLFRAETLASGEGIGVRDLTLLFTDLKGSTELYERVGDLAAFALVQQHFEHLRQAVQQQEGAVVKTIGDAVMASFNEPAQAVRAALAMHREIEAFNARRGTRDLILKIGIHRGHSIAVTLNERLDYFGQTVNIAARVQGIAEADQLCLTPEVLDAPGVRELLGGRNVREETAKLKGIQDSMRVYRVNLA